MSDPTPDEPVTRKAVKRFDFELEVDSERGCAYVHKAEWPEGAYVYADDYDALQRRCEAAERVVTAARQLWDGRWKHERGVHSPEFVEALAAYDAARQGDGGE